MPLPKKRHNSARGRRRRSGHKKLTLSKLVKCSTCGKPVKAHVACPSCGHYKKKAVAAASSTKTPKKK